MRKKILGLLIALICFYGISTMSVSAATGSDVANAAWNYLGVSRDYYDCSAFVQKVYSDVGVTIPRLTYDQADCGTRIYTTNINDLQPGDIICFGSNSNSSNITHVGLYCGNDVVLHSSYSKWQIAQDSLSRWISSGYYSPPYQFAVRVLSGGVHTHSYNGSYYESAHPHREYQACSCGEKRYTGNTGYLSSCTTCNPPITVYKRVHCQRIITIGSGVKAYLYSSPTASSPTKYYLEDYKYRNWYHIILSNGKIRYEVETEDGTEYFEPTSGISVDIVHTTAYMKANYDTAHPHKRYCVCDCGTKVYDYNGQYYYGYDENCEQCNPHYTLSYNANGGTNAPYSQSARCGENLTISSTKPKRNGYIFVGWGNYPDSTNASYSGGSTLPMPSNNMTLYAVWKEASTGQVFTLDKYQSYTNVTNNGAAQTVTVIVADYTNGVLTDTSSQVLNFDEGQTKSFTYGNGTEHKVFVWDSLQHMQSMVQE